MYFVKLVKQFCQNFLIRALCNFFVEIIFCNVVTLVIFGHLSKKLRTFGGKFLAFYYIFGNFVQNVFNVSTGTSEDFFHGKKTLWKFLKTQDIFSALRRRFLAKLSKLQSLCPAEHLEECLLVENFTSIFSIQFNIFRFFVSFFHQTFRENFLASKRTFEGKICC